MTVQRQIIISQNYPKPIKKGMANKPENRVFQTKCNLKCS